MRRSDFKIGTEFYTDPRKWRCTDVGTHVIVGISLESRRKVEENSGVRLTLRSVAIPLILPVPPMESRRSHSTSTIPAAAFLCIPGMNPEKTFGKATTYSPGLYRHGAMPSAFQGRGSHFEVVFSQWLSDPVELAQSVKRTDHVGILRMRHARKAKKTR